MFHITNNHLSRIINEIYAIFTTQRTWNVRDRSETSRRGGNVDDEVDGCNTVQNHQLSPPLLENDRKYRFICCLVPGVARLPIRKLCAHEEITSLSIAISRQSTISTDRAPTISTYWLANHDLVKSIYRRRRNHIIVPLLSLHHGYCVNHRRIERQDFIFEFYGNN